jgi:hypothetical protein
MTVVSNHGRDGYAFARLGRGAVVSLLLPLVTAALVLLALSTLTWNVGMWTRQAFADLRYGQPHLTSTSGQAFLGDQTERPTVVLALNLDGQIHLLVLPASDPSRLEQLDGPYLFGDEGDKVPRVELRDGNRDGQNDLVLEVKGERVWYLNQEDGHFRLMTTEEWQQMRNEATGE